MKWNRFLIPAVAIVSIIAVLGPSLVLALGQGDVNGDGQVNMSDIVKTELVVLGLSAPTDAADVNKDGTTDVADLTALERLVLGLNPVNAKPVISASTSSISDAGYYYVMGDVINNLTTNIDRVRIDANFYDANNQLIGKSYAYTAVDILKPGQWSLFSINTYPDKYMPARYELSLSWHETDQTAPTVTITSQAANTTAEGYYRVTGNVTNQSATTSFSVRVFCTYFDAANRTIGYDFTYTTPSVVSPNSTAPFQIYSYPKVLKPDHYSLDVQATPSGQP